MEGPNDMLIRIEAPYFCAGVVLAADPWPFEVAVRAAPIVKYMVGWGRGRIVRYCVRKGWKVTTLP